MRALILMALLAMGSAYAQDLDRESTAQLTAVTCMVLEQERPDLPSCVSVPPPVVIVTQLVDEASSTWQGVHFLGEKYIFINTFAISPNQTLVHEMVHYLLSNMGLGKDEVCEHERLARSLSGQEWDARTKERYGCTES